MAIVPLLTLLWLAWAGESSVTSGFAMLEHIHGRSTLDAMRKVVREELAPYKRA